MPKHPKPAPSPFDALVQARKQPSQSPVQMADQSDSQPGGVTETLAKRADRNYIKFTTYIRKATHRAVKLKLLEQDRELSDLVEQLLSDWLQRQSGQ